MVGQKKSLVIVKIYSDQIKVIILTTILACILNTPVNSAEVGGCGADGGDPRCASTADPGSTPKTGTPNVGSSNPINLITGNKYQREDDHQPYLGNTATKLVFMRHYNSANTDNDFGLGPGWSMSYDTRIGQLSEQQLQIVQSDGRRIVFTRKSNPETNESKYQAVNPTDGTIYQNDHHYRWYLRDGRALYFNLDGQLTRIHHQTRNITLTMYRNTRGWLTQVRDDAERRIQLQYYDKKDAQQTNGINVTDRLHGKLRRITIPTGETIHYHYDQAGNLRQVTYPNQTTRSYHYEDVNHPHALTGITNEKNTRTVTWGYDQEGRANLSEQAAQVGRVTLDYQLPLHANELGRTLVTNSLGQQATYTWRRDALQAQALLLRGEGIACSSCPKTGVQYQYNENYQLSEATFQDYLSIRYRYDNLGRLSSLTQQAEDTPEQMIERFEYLGETNLKTAIHRPSVKPNSEYIITYTYDQNQQLIQIDEQGYSPDSEYNFDPIHRITRLRYKNRNLVEINGPRGDVSDVIQLNYDHEDQLAKIITPDQVAISVLAYDQYARPVKLQPTNQKALEIKYTERGLLKQIKQGANTIDYAYDHAGKINHVSTSNGKKISVTYDDAGRLRELRNGIRNRIKVELDTESNILASTVVDNGIVKTLTYLYDATGRLNQFQGGDGNVVANYEYDNLGNLVQIQDAEGNVNPLYQPNLDSMFEAALASNTKVQSNALKEQENIESVTDARGNTTDYVQDDFGRIVTIESPDTGLAHYVYDNANNIIKEINALGQKTTYEYDAANQLISWKDDKGLVRIQYSQGQISEIIDKYSTEKFKYDGLGNVAEHTRHIDGFTFTTAYHYDEETGRLKYKDLLDGQTLRFHYHENGKLHAITRKNLLGQSTIIGEINTSEANRHYVHGNGIVTDYQYNAEGQLTSIYSQQVHNLEYQYDQRGNIIGIQLDGIANQYNYDSIGRLTNAINPTVTYAYQYDELGNRTQTTENEVTTNYRYANYAEGNRLLSKNENQQYEYNAAGSPTKIGTKTYEYDTDQRPTKLYINNQLKAEYTYNGFGERIKKVSYQGNQKQVTYYFYNGEGKLTAEADETGTITSQYVYLNHQPIAKLEHKKIYAIHTDRLGTSHKVTDKQGEIIWAAEYSPFGKAKITTAHITLNLRFPGQYYDQESDTHYNYLRDYDPETGRYLTSDPIGLEGGINLYAYVNNNPLALMDLRGTSPLSWLAKQAGKKVAVKKFKKELVKQLKPRLDRLLEKDNLGDAAKKQLQKDYDEILEAISALSDGLDVWDLIELVPIAGDAVGAYRFIDKCQNIASLLKRFTRKTIGFSRLPAKGSGKWTGGIGQGKFTPNKDTDLYKALPDGNKSITYKDGMPDLKPFSKGNVKIKGLKGTDADKAAAIRKMKKENPGWEQPPNTDWHHDPDCLTMVLIDKTLHKALGHTGGAEVIKQGACN